MNAACQFIIHDTNSWVHLQFYVEVIIRTGGKDSFPGCSPCIGWTWKLLFMHCRWNCTLQSCLFHMNNFYSLFILHVLTTAANMCSWNECTCFIKLWHTIANTFPLDYLQSGYWFWYPLSSALTFTSQKPSMTRISCTLQ